MDLNRSIGQFKNEIYFFILRKVKDEHHAKDIFQNTCLRALENAAQIKNPDKIRAWLYQITRNQISDFFKRQRGQFISVQQDVIDNTGDQEMHSIHQDCCCFDNFIQELPESYKDVVTQIYLRGRSQKETADLLHITLANVKIKVSRAKSILKTKFNECCHYQIDANGKLTGEPDCARCHSILNPLS